MTAISTDPGWLPVAASDGDIGPEDPWYDALTSVPRHLFSPRWWEPVSTPSSCSWTLRDGPAIAAERPGAWSAVFDRDRPVVTEVGGLHADDAEPGDHPEGPVTAVNPALMDLTYGLFESADVRPGCTVLLAEAAEGYACALLAHQLGDDAVTALAVGRTASRARARLAELGLHPRITDRPEGSFNRMISAVPHHAVPARSLAALAPGGRLAALYADGSMVSAVKAADGTARGHIFLDIDRNDPTIAFDCSDPTPAPITVQPDGTLALRLPARTRTPATSAPPRSGTSSNAGGRAE